jgi:hypothetical protein
MLETRQIWKLKFANPKLGMETSDTFGNTTYPYTPNYNP